MSLLTVVQNACRAIGQNPPSVVVASSDATVLELYILATKSGQELARQYDWPELLKEASFSATSQVNQGNIIGVSASALISSSDYERMIPDTFWNRTADEKIIPATDSEWQQLIASGSAPITRKFKIIQKQLHIGPVSGPTAGNLMGFFYRSNMWCESSAGTAQRSWAADTDRGIIPEQILELDLIWRWKQAKGRQYGEDMETAERSINRYVGAAPGRRLLMLGGGSNYGYTTNIPEGNWNQ